MDGAKFPEFYGEWLAGAEEDERLAKARGLEIVRITIEPGAFSAWCRLKEISPNAEARRRYVRHGALVGRPPKDWLSGSDTSHEHAD